MKNLISTFCLLFVFTTNVFAQDVAFANTNQSLLYLNPSFVGSNGGLRVQSNYQNAPYPSSGNYGINWQNAADVYLKKWKGAFALTYGHSNVRSELYKTQNIGLTYAQHFTINKVKIIPSLQVAYFQRQMDLRELGIHEFYEITKGRYPERLPDIITKHCVDFSSGVLLQYENFYMGISAFHINQPDIGLLNTQKLPALINIHASYNFILSEKTLVQISQRFTLQENDGAAQFNANAVFFKHFVCGLGFSGQTAYTTSYSTIVNLGYRANYFSATLLCGKGFDKKGFNYRDVWELALSFNLRDKKYRKTLLAFEAW